MEKKALHSCLGIKQSTSDGILYVEINKPDIVTTIYSRQQKFYEKFKSIDIELFTAKRIWQKSMDMNDFTNKPFLQHFESIQNSPLSLTIDLKKESITASDKTMDIGYRELFNLKYNDMLYNSMIDDSYIIIVTRWRLPSHKLYIETGRYKVPFIPRQDRTCMICSGR